MYVYMYVYIIYIYISTSYILMYMYMYICFKYIYIYICIYMIYIYIYVCVCVCVCVRENFCVFVFVLHSCICYFPLEEFGRLLCRMSSGSKPQTEVFVSLLSFSHPCNFPVCVSFVGDNCISQIEYFFSVCTFLGTSCFSYN